MRNHKKFLAVALAFALTVPASANINSVKLLAADKAITATAPAEDEGTEAPVAKEPTLSAPKATIIKGDTLTLTVNDLDKSNVKKITWKANRTSIAKVSTAGKVTPVKAGTTTIICTINYKDKTTKELKCSVTIKDRVVATKVAFTNVKLNEAGKMEVPLGTTFKLKTKITPTKTTDKIYWVSSNTKIATVSTNGTITPVKVGSCTIAAKAGLNEKSATASSNKIVARVKVQVVKNPATEVKFTEEAYNADDAKVELNIDSQLQIGATLVPSTTTDKLYWISDNTKVAKVDANGLVTPVAVGTCKIFAVAADKKANAAKSTVKAVLTITVSDPAAEALKESIAVAAEELKTISEAEIGATVTYGKYEQDNKLDNGKEAISWYVLDKTEDGKAMLISKHVLDAVQYNPGWDDTSWADCALRAWLNDDFMNTTFSKAEIERIAATESEGDCNPYYNVSYSEATTDQVSLLSIREAAKYFDFVQNKNLMTATKTTLRGVPTKYAKAKGVDTSSKTGDTGKYSWWWIKTPGRTAAHVSFIDDALSITLDGRYATTNNFGLRPVIWVDFSELIVTPEQTPNDATAAEADTDASTNNSNIVFGGSFSN